MNGKTERRERALQCFAEDLHCSQSILAAFSEECGITEEQAFRLGSCFGSGMRKGDVCGACTGALMVLGLMYGEIRAGDREGRQRTNELNDLMMNRFSEVNGSCLCNDLLGCDIRTPEGVQYARDNHLFTEFCPKMVESAVRILEEIIQSRSDSTHDSITFSDRNKSSGNCSSVISSGFFSQK